MKLVQLDWKYALLCYAKTLSWSVNFFSVFFFLLFARSFIKHWIRRKCTKFCHYLYFSGIFFFNQIKLLCSLRLQPLSNNLLNLKNEYNIETGIEESFKKNVWKIIIECERWKSVSIFFSFVQMMMMMLVAVEGKPLKKTTIKTWWKECARDDRFIYISHLEKITISMKIRQMQSKWRKKKKE